MDIARLTVYCGSSPGADPAHLAGARALGTVLAERGIGLAYGGAHVGLMGALADAALAAGGDVVGVMTEALVEREVAHRGLTELRVVPTMHERKALMADLGSAFAMLPGGFGTLDEFCEAVTWTQLGVHAKPCGILDGTGFYRPLLDQFDRAVDEGFVRADHRGLVVSAATPAELLDRLAAWRPIDVDGWLDSFAR